MLRKQRSACLLLSLCASVPFVAVQGRAALILNTNLIVNGDAEAGPPGSLTNNMVVPAPGWLTTPNQDPNVGFTVVQYTTMPMSVPRFTDPGPPVRGLNFFAGGKNPNPEGVYIATAHQTLDISDGASLVDSGLVPFTLSGYLGGYFDQRDNAMLSAVFENGNTILNSSSIGPVTELDRMLKTGLLFRSNGGFIPAGTRQIDFQILINGIDGNQADGYLDNLSFVAGDPARGPATVPEPGSMGLLGLGLTGLGLYFRRNRRHS